MASSPLINDFNVRLRASPIYTDWMRRQGIDPSRPIRLSDRQRKDFKAYLQAQGMPVPNGVEIDSAGNMNENEGFWTQTKRWGPIVGAGALTAFGIPGVMPGVFAGGGAASTTAAAGGRAGLSGWLQTALLAGLPAVTNLVGAKMAMSAADRAAEIQWQSYREGIAELKRQYDLERSDFEPYRQTGTVNLQRMSDLVGSRTPEPYVPVPIRDTQRGGGSMAALASSQTQPHGSMADLQQALLLSQRPETVSTTQPVREPMVMMQAPTGQRKPVPLSRVAMFESRGARRV